MAAKKNTTETAKPKTAEINPDTSAVGINNADTTSTDTATDTETGTDTDTDTDANATELPATVKIKFNKNVRYNRTSYVKDDKIDVPVADYEQMTEHCEIIESAE